MRQTPQRFRHKNPARSPPSCWLAWHAVFWISPPHSAPGRPGESSRSEFCKASPAGCLAQNPLTAGGDRYAGGGISFPNRLLGSWSILCRKPETHVPDAPPDSLGRAVRDRGLPLHVLGRDAALSLPQASILHLRNRYRDYHARGVRRSPHLARRPPVLEPVRVENAVIARNAENGLTGRNKCALPRFPFLHQTTQGCLVYFSPISSIAASQR